ncbi:unnamed protein product [Ectocarpus fasciculatus]
MKRVFGAVSGAFRSLVPKATAPAAHHQESVRKAMESLAPPGRRLPSESKTLAMELVAAASEGDKEKELLMKTPEEMVLAANALHQGKHIPADKQTAFALWKKAAEAGHPKAMYSYAGCLRKGDGTKKDLPTAVSLFERLGDQGLLEAKHALGLVLSSGEGEDVGIPQDEERALELFKAAATGGFVPAIHAAASMMEAGKGGDKEDAKAVQWLEVAMEAGDPMAYSTLATWYTAGRAGLELDHDKAFELHLQAANMNMPRAQYNTAVHYLEGTGTEQNLLEAAAWFERAGALGMPQAMLNLGKMLENGIGVEVDRERALKLYQAALRAEGQLEEGLAAAGDDTMAALFKAKQQGLLSDTKKGDIAREDQTDGHGEDQGVKQLGESSPSSSEKASA